MVWETIKREGKSIANFNHWPSPFNFVKRINVLVCNQDTWIAEIELAFTMAAYFFWTNVVPSPRELERKSFTGGYRCGFYIDVGVKSPVEILFGEGTARMIAEIASPFAQGLFWFWAEGALLDVFAMWETLLYPQLVCDPPTGTAARKNDIAEIPPGHTTGVPGLGTEVYNHLHLAEDNHPIMNFPPGGQSCFCAWLFNAGPSGLTNVKTGWQVNGVVQDLVDHGNVIPGAQKQVTRDYSVFDTNTNEVAAYFEADGGVAVIGGAAIAVVWVATWDPLANPGFTNPYQPLADDPRQNPRCSQSVF